MDSEPRDRRLISSGAPWESEVGYSRAVRVGPHIAVAGTTAMVDGQVVAPGNAYHQTIAVLEIIKQAIEDAGGLLSDVIRTRIYVTDITQWEAIGRAHGMYFGIIRPAATMVQVSRLIDPDLVVEIEADAIVASSGGT